MNGPHRDEPQRLRVVGATDLEQRLLGAAGAEQPSPELTRRMARGLGIAAGAGLAAVARATAAAPPAAAGSGLFWPAVWAAVAAMAVAGGVAGWARGHGRPVPVRSLVAAASPRPTGAPPPAATEPREAPVAAPPTHHHRPTPPAADLGAEIALVDAARAAISGGEAARALVLLRRYDSRFPSGTFRPESSALQVEALAHLGQAERAQALGRAFIAAHPDSPLVPRVQRAIARAP